MRAGLRTLRLANHHDRFLEWIDASRSAPAQGRVLARSSGNLRCQRWAPPPRAAAFGSREVQCSNRSVRSRDDVWSARLVFWPAVRRSFSERPLPSPRSCSIRRVARSRTRQFVAGPIPIRTLTTTRWSHVGARAIPTGIVACSSSSTLRHTFRPARKSHPRS